MVAELKGTIKSYKKNSKGLVVQIEVTGSPNLKEISEFIDDETKVDISISTSQTKLD